MKGEFDAASEIYAGTDHRKLREVEVAVARGATISEACRGIEVSEQTLYRWRREYGGMKVDQAKRLAGCPARHHGRLEFFLWNAMKCWPVPVKARRLSSIIGNERRVLIAEKPCDSLHEKGRNDDVPTDKRKRRSTGS